MITIKNLTVQVQENTVLQDIDLTFQEGKNYCLLGRNWSGKSSLAMSIIWHPKYEITGGQILLTISDKELEDMDESTQSKIEEHIADKSNWSVVIDISTLDADIRSKLGIFVAFQNIPEIKGIKLFEFLRQIYNQKFGTNETFVSFKKIIEPLIDELHIEKDLLWRDLNVWFSGGEKRKVEILQLKLLDPKYIFLDEIDSGLDIDALRNVTRLIQDHNHHHNTLIFITHYFDILDQIDIDKIYMIKKWHLHKTWGKEMIQDIKRWWYEDMQD